MFFVYTNCLIYSYLVHKSKNRKKYVIMKIEKSLFLFLFKSQLQFNDFGGSKSATKNFRRNIERFFIYCQDFKDVLAKTFSEI